MPMKPNSYPSGQKYLTGWRYVAFISGLVGAVGLALYPILIKPLYDNSEYNTTRKYEGMVRSFQASTTSKINRSMIER
ncbi:hypothetical protein M8J76_012410 [Diaphorina citri]|nr:hypothetical protein M8J76_009322 [Diaphorina citri]KAI5733479.1 hypothetical protein M8J76_012410 [Diaphorina citri]